MCLVIVILHCHAVRHQEGGQNLGIFECPAAFFEIDLAHLPRRSARGMQCAIGMASGLDLAIATGPLHFLRLTWLISRSAQPVASEEAAVCAYGGQLFQANLVTCMVELLAPYTEHDTVLTPMSDGCSCACRIACYVTMCCSYTRAWHVVRHADIHEWHGGMLLRVVQLRGSCSSVHTPGRADIQWYVYCTYNGQ
jgi:hypothetical protein